MTKLLNRLILTLMAALCLSACSDADDGPAMANVVVSDIATFVDNNYHGAVFTLRRVDDSPLVTLQSNVMLDTAKVHPGTRIYLSYRPQAGEGYVDTDITIRGISLITNGKLGIVDAAANFPQWDADGVYVYSLWRTGEWVNLDCRLTYTQEPREFALVADGATVGDKVPQLYLVHRIEPTVVSHDRRYYASFNIGALWSKPHVEGVDIHIANTNLTQLTTFSFRK